MNDHHINIFYSAEDEGYIADIPDLKFCSAFGATPERALAEVLAAKRLWIQTAEDIGREVPKSVYRPPIFEMAELVLAWDPDFTKVTPHEAESMRQGLAEIERGEYIRHEDIDWG